MGRSYTDYLRFLKYLPVWLWARRKFSDFRPQPLTFDNITKWLTQFDSADRGPILRLLGKIEYYSEARTRSVLLQLNDSLLRRLSNDGIPVSKVIYVQVHDAGSSSPVILNLLKDGALLERKGCSFLDSKDVRGLSSLTGNLGEGAIIYVDDFCATGNQFCEVRDFIADYVVGNFAEFFLLPTICEEALYELGQRNVEAVASIHSKVDRPLHPISSKLSMSRKSRLVSICQEIDRKGALGYRGLATMVVFYRQPPNTLPVLFRGCVGQSPWVGILPRTTDLPISSADV